MRSPANLSAVSQETLPCVDCIDRFGPMFCTLTVLPFRRVFRPVPAHCSQFTFRLVSFLLSGSVWEATLDRMLLLEASSYFVCLFKVLQDTYLSEWYLRLAVLRAPNRTVWTVTHIYRCAVKLIPNDFFPICSIITLTLIDSRVCSGEYTLATALVTSRPSA